MPGPCRSVLFLPASNPRAIEKARTLDCDVVILDLEDAVAPDQKDSARQAAIEALQTGGFKGRVGVRINPPTSDWGREDLHQLPDAKPELVVIPKLNSLTDLTRTTEACGAACGLWAMVESPRGLLSLTSIADVGPPLEALVLGINDLAVALDTGESPDREPLKPWLAQTVAAARSNGLLAIDGVFNAHRDTEGFAAEAAQARLFGFDGKCVIHPSQIAPANAAFTPTQAAIKQAEAIVAAFAAPEAQDKGAIDLNGRMVERLHLEAARRLLTRAGVGNEADAEDSVEG